MIWAPLFQSDFLGGKVLIQPVTLKGARQLWCSSRGYIAEITRRFVGGTDSSRTFNRQNTNFDG